MRGVDLFVERHAEVKENIICIQRLAVREFYSLAQHEWVYFKRPLEENFRIGERRSVS